MVVGQLELYLRYDAVAVRIPYRLESFVIAWLLDLLGRKPPPLLHYSPQW
jgi:hypothetical protein